MKVISTNLAEERTIQFNGKEVKTGIYKFPVKEALHLGHNGVNKDHVADRSVHGGLDKACYSYSSESYEFWKKHYPNLDWEWGMFGENLTISGLKESDIRIGDIYKMGEALVQVSQPRQPCYKLGVRFESPQMVKKFVKADYPGCYFRVMQEGLVKVGDKLTLEMRNKNSITLLETFKLLYGLITDDELVDKAMGDPNLAQSCKKDLGSRWGG